MRGGYILNLPARSGGRPPEYLSTLLLVKVLACERAWRFNALHFHISYLLLMQLRFWRGLFRRPVIISQH
jgi:hypothetical protein